MMVSMKFQVNLDPETWVEPYKDCFQRIVRSNHRVRRDEEANSEGKRDICPCVSSGRSVQRVYCVPVRVYHIL